jgi:hypothetical protein
MSQVKERSMWSLIDSALGLTSRQSLRTGRDRVKGSRRARPPRRARPEVEALETRTLLSTGFQATVARTLNHVYASETSRTVTDSGGPVIKNVDVDLIFWGYGWLTASKLMNDVTNSVQTIMNSPYLSGLAQYRGIGNGRLLRTDSITSTQPAANTTDSQFDALVQANINNGSLPVTPNMDSQILYVVIPQPGTTDPKEGDTGAHARPGPALRLAGGQGLAAAAPGVRAGAVADVLANLNLIERLWTFLRQRALGRWHRTFEAMPAAVSEVLDHLSECRKELDTLMTEHFHIVAKAAIPVEYREVACVVPRVVSAPGTG